MIRLALALALAACSKYPNPPFHWPKQMDDVRARLLQNIPEGRDIAEAREWMGEHGYACGADNVCRAVARDAGYSAWTITLVEFRGRLRDVRVE